MTMANNTPVEHLLRGHKATLQFTRTGFTITPERLAGDPKNQIVHKKTGGEQLDLPRPDYDQGRSLGACSNPTRQRGKTFFPH